MTGDQKRGNAGGGGKSGGGGAAKKSKKQYLQGKGKGKGQQQSSGDHWSTRNKDKSPLNSGLRGFLFTCDTSKDAVCTREALDMLDEHIQDMYPEEYQKLRDEGAEEDAPAAGGALDVQAELDRERKGMERVARKMFSVVKTTLRGLVFIRAIADWIDVCGVTEEILTNISRTKQMKSRFINKIHPVEITAFSSVEAIVKAAKPLIAKHLPESMPKTYAFMFRSRGNNQLHRVDLFPPLGESVPACHKVDLDNPELTFLIEVMTNTAMVSVVRKYNELGKYNLFSVCETEEEQAARLEKERERTKRDLATKAAKEAAVPAESSESAAKVEEDKTTVEVAKSDEPEESAQ